MRRRGRRTGSFGSAGAIVDLTVRLKKVETGYLDVEGLALPDLEATLSALEDGKDTGFTLQVTNDPLEAAAGADAIYTDVWASMGQEAEKEARARIFAPYQVNARLMAQAKKDAIFMHCLPAHRGDEVTDEVIDAPTSVVYDEAENRLHAQKAILIALMGDKD